MKKHVQTPFKNKSFNNLFLENMEIESKLEREINSTTWTYPLSCFHQTISYCYYLYSYYLLTDLSHPFHNLPLISQVLHNDNHDAPSSLLLLYVLYLTHFLDHSTTSSGCRLDASLRTCYCLENLPNCPCLLGIIVVVGPSLSSSPDQAWSAGL